MKICDKTFIIGILLNFGSQRGCLYKTVSFACDVESEVVISWLGNLLVR